MQGHCLSVNDQGLRRRHMEVREASLRARLLPVACLSTPGIGFEETKWLEIGKRRRSLHLRTLEGKMG